MFALAKLLNTLTLLYIAAATVAGLGASHATGTLLADLLGSLLGIAVLVLPAIPYALTLAAQLAFTRIRARRARRAHHVMLVLITLFGAACALIAPPVLVSAAPVLAGFAGVSCLDLVVLGRLLVRHDGRGYSWQ